MNIYMHLSILEAFACKKMVFAFYNNPIKKDYLEMTPFKKWIVIEKDPKKMANKVIDYLNNPAKYQPLIDRAYEWVKKQTWEKITEKYLQLWGVQI